MKNILALILCFNIFALPAYSVITDDFAENSLDKSLQINPIEQKIIQDDFAENTLNKNLKIKQNNYITIQDEFAENNNNKNTCVVRKQEIKEILPTVSKDKIVTKKLVIFDTSTAIKVPVHASKTYSTRQKHDEGDFIEFKTVREVRINNKLYPAGTIVKARIENISKNRLRGVPSDLIVGNFSIDGTPLAGEIEKTGANRSLWVYPCICAFNVFFGVGLLFIFIRGGHAKIKPSQTYTLYAQ